jgi:hypothetical protein
MRRPLIDRRVHSGTCHDCSLIRRTGAEEMSGQRRGMEGGRGGYEERATSRSSVVEDLNRDCGK